MKILAVSNQYPMPDKNAGELRFFSMLKLMGRNHEVFFCGYRFNEQVESIGIAKANEYRSLLSGINVKDLGGDIDQIVKNNAFDIVLFEFYYSSRRNYVKAKFYNKDTVVVVDTVDIHYKRLQSKYGITGNDDDRQKAVRMKRRELKEYRRADAVITATGNDDQCLRLDLNDIVSFVIPTIHEMKTCSNPAGSDDKDADVIFVGGFNHDPNLDAVLYFNEEILPLVRQKLPGIRVKIVGNNPPDSIKALAGENFIVTGFVPDTHPHLSGSRVSIAPLRYGAGMKGKVGEALASGIPVVTTSVGAEGFGFTPGREVLVADTPGEFADAVIRLLSDRALYDEMSRSGQQFIRDRYSPEAVGLKLEEMIEKVARVKPKQLSLVGSALFWLKNARRK
jgi:glycosyltransferase involved in cell wall biosynthesis